VGLSGLARLSGSRPLRDAPRKPPSPGARRRPRHGPGEARGTVSRPGGFAVSLDPGRPLPGLPSRCLPTIAESRTFYPSPFRGQTRFEGGALSDRNPRVRQRKAKGPLRRSRL
jgi:hypothetical protein